MVVLMATGPPHAAVCISIPLGILLNCRIQRVHPTRDAAVSVTDTVMMFIFSPSAPPFFLRFAELLKCGCELSYGLDWFCQCAPFALSDVKELRF